MLIGQNLGPYLVRSLIGEGGMGVVYSGEHTTIGRRVALKVLRPELSLRDDIVERFIREARAVNTIGHANIVNIYDFGKTPFGSFFIVMEYLDGLTVRGLLDEQGPQPLDRARRIVIAVGAALAAAHAKGFIHRDVKPENIIYIKRNGSSHVKLVDFGIAKLLTQDSTYKTTTGSAMGTPQYMSPEQLEDTRFDHRADIYSLGAVAFEMLTGTLPYPGKSHAEVRQMQLTRTPTPPSELRSDTAISRQLDAAILWALNPDPTNRCARIEEFLAAFEKGYVETLSAPHGVPRTARPRKLPLILAVSVGIIAMLVGGSLVYWLKISDRQTTGDTADASAPDSASTGALSAAEAEQLAGRRVREALSSPDASTRERAVRYLSELRRPVMQKELRRALKDKYPGVRRGAALALGNMMAKESIPDLQRALAGSVGFAAWDIAGALAQLKDPKGTMRLHADLKQLTAPQHEIKRQYILHILGRLGDSSARAWEKLITDRRRMVSQTLRRKALGYLATLGDKAATAELSKVISQNDWPAKIEAAEALMPSNDQLARKTLHQALEQASGKFRLKAAQLLAYSGDAKAAKVLVESLDSPDRETRRVGALAMGNLPGPSSYKRLRRGLRDPVQEVALATAVALLSR